MEEIILDLIVTIDKFVTTTGNSSANIQYLSDGYKMVWRELWIIVMIIMKKDIRSLQSVGYKQWKT